MARKFEKAQRIKELPPYLFAEIDRKKKEALAKGVNLIDLGIGDPDIPTPPQIIEKLKEAAHRPNNHRYPSSAGLLAYRQAVADWYLGRFGVKLDPAKEVISLIGSKEGIANMAVAFVDPGDVVLATDPAYPVYQIGTQFNGGKIYHLPLLKQNRFLPDLKAIPKDVLDQAKMLWFSYPNNPTAAVAEKEFFEEIVEFAHRHKIILCHDAAYTEISFDDYRPMSLLQVDGAKEVGIEFHSLSKTFNMTGWRLGMAVGNANLVGGLVQVKSNIDSGVFQAVQEAGIEALQRAEELIEPSRKIYQERRDVLVSALHTAGLECEIPRATFYVWVTVPKGNTSAQLATRLLEEAGIISTPGNGFGRAGEGYIRFTLCVTKERLKEVGDRIQCVKF